ncbi:DUF559 domain-containing protein [Rhizobium sp. LjRoot98]|uniref:endonuclease domain-containing protein n=1 Tax=unclassified Rhizobium TaxID=2613769 RepID=UPI001FCCC189|nr:MULTISPECIES: DUF559 domain-containing protein [unclassified Rhizobium]
MIIELDGSQHASDAGLQRDERRTAFLENEGYHVLRFWNSDVFEDLNAVLDTIFAIVQQRQILLAEANHFHPTPARRAAPLHRGEGEEEI